jgi:hypothetical protein
MHKFIRWMWVGLLMAQPLSGLAVEIPLESVSPVRIGYIDLQKVFDTFPEKAFAEGDLLKEVQKRRTEMGAKQQAINVMRQQIAADQKAYDDSQAGKPVTVPHDDVAALQPTAPAPPPSRLNPFPVGNQAIGADSGRFTRFLPESRPMA